MMLRRSGKRIRLDDPPPPELENAITPESGQAVHGAGSDRYTESHDGSGETPQLQDMTSYSSTASDDTPVRPRRSKRKAAEAAAAAATLQVIQESPVRTRRGRQAAAANVTVFEPPEDAPVQTKRKAKTSPAAKKTVPATPEEPMEDDNSLCAAIIHGRSSLQSLVDEWIEDYKSNRDASLLVLMQFFISSSGCKGRITAQMQAQMEHAGIIRKMTEEFDEEGGEYPLVMSGIQWKKFRSNFGDFVQMLVKQCQYSIIYDQYLMDNIISLVTLLSDSQVRAFRHTATLAAMKLMTALVDVALTVSINLDNTQRQYDAERQKGSSKRASDRLETLMLKRQELEENMEDVKNVLTYMFKSVFVHRYRDSLPEIRAICMSEIGIWMKKFHQNFLDDSYLKYIGWTLHDKIGEVRLKCLQALQPLYASEELKGKLELFTSKFKDRIVAMTLDKEYEVAVQAVKLVISIHKYHREILSDKDCELVYELVYSSHRAVAQAAGEFLNERLFVLDDSAVENVRSAHGKQRLPNTPLIRDLVQFFIESELHEHGAYLVDSLIDSNPMMKDWECMTDLLLEDPGPTEEALDDKQETSLTEIMICAVKQCASGEPPIGRGPTRKILSAKELKCVSDEKTRLTEHFIPTLPSLLSKFKMDSDKVANLLSLPQYFDLEIYTTSRQERSLDLLLELISEITHIHTEVEVLEVAAKSLEIICCDDARKSSRTEVALMRLLEVIWNRASSAIDDYEAATENGGEADVDELYNLSMSLRKISVFSGCHSFDKWDIWDKLFLIIKDTTKTTKTYPEDAVKSVIATCYFTLLWDLKNIQEKGDTGLNVHHEMEKLVHRISEYMMQMKELLTKSDSITYQEEAYTSLCDALVIFCEQLASSAWIEPLVYRPTPDLQEQLNAFMQLHVFSEDRDEDADEHARIELLHKRRNFLGQYCKLIVYNIFPIRTATDVFKHYVKYYNDYGDIIKATLGKAREINKVNCSVTMVWSLRTLFRQLPRTNGWMVDRASEDFGALKDLAKRFALSFGLDPVKNREAITTLHREGILLSITPLENPNDPTGPPPNLDFLEILSEFTNKLIKQDKRVVLHYLDKRVAAATPSSQGSQWQPLYTYRNSLMHGESDHPVAIAKRAYARKRQAADDEENVDEEEDAADME